MNITNASPTVSEITAPLDPVVVGTQISADATFTDPGTDDTHVAVWYWGDNTTSEGYINPAVGSVSGIFDRVKGMCQKNGIHRHATTYSLGIWGRTEKLPPDEVLDVITMCGHGMISAARLNSVAEDVKAGRKSTQDAAKELARQCDCGVFNPARAAKLLAAMAK